jgi:hypothetical protein
MTPLPTEKEFSQQLNTKYLADVPESQPIELELVEVKSYPSGPGEQEGMERFSIFFLGPAETFLPQDTYRVTHEEMGDLDLFLVPIAREELGFRYETIINYFT